MAHVTHYPSVRIERIDTGLGVALAKLGRAYRSWRQAQHNRELAAELSDTQLADAGLDRSKLAGNKPTIEVRPGTMANLMSMR